MDVSGKRDILAPFRAALNGIVYTFKNESHLRFQMYIVLVPLPVVIFMNFGLREVLVALFVLSLVLIAEMFNSAIEATVDLIEPKYNPQAKFAKDIAAGAVLITTIIALVVCGLLLLGEDRWEQIKVNLTADTPSLPFMLRFGFGLLLVFIIVIIGKGLGKRGQVLKGGLVSGHSAYGFFFATGIMFLTDQVVVSALAVLLAAMIAQSRWEAKIHSIYELVLGATVGVVMGLLLFGLMPK